MDGDGPLRDGDGVRDLGDAGTVSILQGGSDVLRCSYRTDLRSFGIGRGSRNGWLRANTVHKRSGVLNSVPGGRGRSCVVIRSHATDSHPGQTSPIRHSYKLAFVPVIEAVRYKSASPPHGQCSDRDRIPVVQFRMNQYKLVRTSTTAVTFRRLSVQFRTNKYDSVQPRCSVPLDSSARSTHAHRTRGGIGTGTDLDSGTRRVARDDDRRAAEFLRGLCSYATATAANATSSHGACPPIEHVLPATTPSQRYRPPSHRRISASSRRRQSDCAYPPTTTMAGPQFGVPGPGHLAIRCGAAARTKKTAVAPGR